MFRFSFGPTAQPLQRILCLGAHCDDIEIGCGGTLLTLIATYPALHVDWLVFSSNTQRAKEATASAEAFLQGVSSKRILVFAFRDGYFPYDGMVIKEHFERLKLECNPDLIFTHCRHDLHQDHRVLNELTWNTFRNHLILEYEIPKYDGDLGIPNCFVHLTEATYQTKIAYLLHYFQSQENKHWFTQETFRAILRLRGIEARAPEHLAEAFYCRKFVF